MGKDRERDKVKGSGLGERKRRERRGVREIEVVCKRGDGNEIEGREEMLSGAMLRKKVVHFVLLG